MAAENDPAHLPHPPVKWAQRTDVLLLRVPLRSIREEKITLSDRKLSIRLRGGSEAQVFSVELELFKPVLSRDSTQSKTDKELFFRIRKKAPGPYWPRLIRSTVTPSFLKVDYENWRDEDDSGDEESTTRSELLIPAEPISVAQDVVDLELGDPLPDLDSITSSLGSLQYSVNGERGYEQDIPQLEQEPSLESILDQDKDDTLSIEELGIDSTLPEFAAEQEEEERLAEQAAGMDQSLPPYSCVRKDSLLNYRAINRLTLQLSKLAEKRSKYGTPTCIGSGGPYVAVGTSRGVVLLFDFTGERASAKRGQLKSVMSCEGPGRSGPEEHGSVTSLSFNCDYSRLLVGHSKGQLVQWNVLSSVCLRDITHAHANQACVLQVKYTDLYNTALFSDITGSIYTVTFKRVYGTRTQDSVCVFSGSHGEALVFEPLRLQWDMVDHPIAKYHLVAVGTVDKIVVLSLKPTKAVFGSRLSQPADTIPLVAWKICKIRDSGDNQFQPILAMGRGGHLAFAQVSIGAAESLSGKVWKDYRKPYSIIALHWLASLFVVALDSSERAHVIHVPTGQEYQVLDVSSAQIIYGSSSYKGLEAGTGAPKTMIAASQSVCHNSVTMRTGAFEVFMLGESTVHAISIAPWRTRLQQVMASEQSLTSLHKVLDLAMGFYQGKYLGMIGYRGTEKTFKRDVKKAIGQLINTAHTQWMRLSQNKDSSDPLWRKQLKEHLSSMIEKCLYFRLHKVLFSAVLDPPEDRRLEEVHFAALEPFLLRGDIPSLSSALMTKMLDHYDRSGRYQELQSCLVNLDVCSVDRNRAVRMCLDHSLYDAFLYIYNQGYQDYVTPLQELLHQLRKVLRKEEGSPLPDVFRTMGYKLLVYISCSFAGRAYPKGDIPEKLRASVKVEICQLLFVSRNDYDSEDTENYPHLRTLLHFDTREFLNVLTLAFEEPEFESPKEHGLSSRHDIVALLMGIVGRNTDTTASRAAEFTPTQVGCLFTFLARQGARYPGSIQVSTSMYDKVLQYLTAPDEEFITEERQQAFLELLESGALADIDEDRLLAMAEKAKFYRVCERFYQRKRHFAKVLSCYWRDPRRKSQALFYIHQVMSSDSHSPGEKEEIEKATVENFEVLIMTDPRATSRLFVMDFPHLVSSVASRLNPHPQVQFVFLQGVFESKQPRSDLQMSNPVVEKYIELMCSYKPEGLDFFLRNNGHYQLESALVIVEQHKQHGAVAYLKERTGDYEGSYQLLMRVFRVACDQLLQGYFTTAPGKEEWDKVQGDVNKKFEQVLNLILRSSRNLPEDRRNGLWYKFLDVMITVVSRSKKATNKQLVDFFQGLMMKLLNAMTMFISLTEILQLILKDPEFSSGEFKDFKKLLLGMFQTNNYESTLRNFTSRILQEDVSMVMRTMKGLTTRGMSPASLRCVVCSHPAGAALGGQRRDVVLFHCGHLYHTDCLVSTSSEMSSMTCPKCTKTYSVTPGRRGGGGAQPGPLTQFSKESPFQGALASLGLELGEPPSATSELESWQIANIDRITSKPESGLLLSPTDSSSES